MAKTRDYIGRYDTRRDEVRESWVEVVILGVLLAAAIVVFKDAWLPAFDQMMTPYTRPVAPQIEAVR